ncbi:hypothetical protein EO95_07275 [Methanosarcina sp. 1.H.T.1A.1]|uniref:hypothetical protein n=1 Tax=Methanosarcina sp. 1.H.T.1A.1 TaxID=1483602 RepID=UPI000621FD8C|nr:hypothetical protein [Methanosarcina sp. 1.H.T.1A.1]KKH96048.1 hypothetical protein EO95_07275 [Methanosarcina sp. 1.H.T.1A.1]
MNINNENKIKWDIDTSILNNKFILKELFRVLGIAVLVTTGIVFLIILPSILDNQFYSDGTNLSGFKYALMLIGLLFLLTSLFIFAYYGNKYELTYVMDEKGVETLTRAGQKKKNSKVNFLLIVLGLLLRNPTAAGTGFLANAGQYQVMKWKNVKKVTFYPRSNTIVLSGGYGIKSIVFCTGDNYGPVSSRISSHCRAPCLVKEK